VAAGRRQRRIDATARDTEDPVPVGTALV